MFEPEVYSERRKVLKEKVDKGILFFAGNNEAPMNYPGNTYKYRQDSTFLYYWGLDDAGYSAAIDLDSGEEIIFGDDRSIEEAVWMGPKPAMKERAAQVGVTNIKPSESYNDFLKAALSENRKVHFLPQYRHDNAIVLAGILGLDPSSLNEKASVEFIKAVISQREIKEEREIKEIEYAVDISFQMNTAAMKNTKPGIYERDIAGIVNGIALSVGEGLSFPTIFSKHGETLHNHYHGNKLTDGDMTVLDSGAESFLHYASDITRTFPVGGKFTDKQKEIYKIVLKSQLEAIDMMKPGIKYKDVHKQAAFVIAEGLISLGIMKGNPQEAVEQGAHALFFPHGLGHALGLDAHDMENLGEDYVGYDSETRRSEQFGLAYLRFGKALAPGHVITVEPGIYFIPQLIANWKMDALHKNFINYDKVEEYLGTGGVRIEDDVLITKDGHRVLGSQPIPKEVVEVEALCSA